MYLISSTWKRLPQEYETCLPSLTTRMKNKKSSNFFVSGSIDPPIFIDLLLAVDVCETSL